MKLNIAQPGVPKRHVARSAAALLVLMATLENSGHPKALANAGNILLSLAAVSSIFYGMIDAQTAIVEDKLLAGKT